MAYGDCFIKGKFRDGLRVSSNDGLTRRKSLPRIEAPGCNYSIHARMAGYGQAQSDSQFPVIAAVSTHSHPSCRCARPARSPQPRVDRSPGRVAQRAENTRSRSARVELCRFERQRTVWPSMSRVRSSWDLVCLTIVPRNARALAGTRRSCVCLPTAARPGANIQSSDVMRIRMVVSAWTNRRSLAANR